MHLAHIIQREALALEENKLLLKDLHSREVTAAPATQTNPEYSLSHFGYTQQFKAHLFLLFITFIYHFVHNFHTSHLTSTDCCMFLVYHWLNKIGDFFLSAICLGCGSFRSSFWYGFSRSGTHPV